MRVLFILGAGFSNYAGTPLQTGFTEALLAARKFQKSHPSKALVEFLSGFIKNVFGHSTTAKAQYWPELEDVFTCIDMSANSGHHLGSYSPAQLRTIRRALITRMIWMLRQTYGKARDLPNLRWHQLGAFLGHIDINNSAFISMNWDTVLEQRLAEIYPYLELFYGSRFHPADFSKDGTRIESRSTKKKERITVVKMHGSVNWLYCDNCRMVFWFPPEKSNIIASQLLSKEEWKQIDPEYKYHDTQWLCDRCAGVPLSTRIATFSYRKALDFPMFQLAWFDAEHLLRTADKWVFIGYSALSRNL